MTTQHNQLMINSRRALNPNIQNTRREFQYIYTLSVLSAETDATAGCMSTVRRVLAMWHLPSLRNCPTSLCCSEASFL